MTAWSSLNASGIPINTLQDVTLDTVVKEDPTVLQMGRFGDLMTPPNAAEYNFVGDCKLGVYYIKGKTLVAIQAALDKVYADLRTNFEANKLA